MYAAGNNSVPFKIHPISVYFFLLLCLSQGKNAPGRLPCSCLAKCEFKLIFLNYEKRKTIPILRHILSNLVLCGSWDSQGLMVQQRHTGEKMRFSDPPSCAAPLDFSLGKSLVTFNAGRM